MITKIARLISIAGHPALLMPVASVIATNPAGDSGVQLLSILVAMFFACLVFIYSQVKTKTGQWTHVDASLKDERKELNIIASLTLFIGTIILALFEVHAGVVAAVGLAGAIVLCCHLLRGVAKPSLHLGFAIFAACITLPNKIAVAALLCFAILIGWSRLQLNRHSVLDLAIGASIGFAAGVCFLVVVYWV